MLAPIRPEHAQPGSLKTVLWDHFNIAILASRGNSDWSATAALNVIEFPCNSILSGTDTQMKKSRFHRPTHGPEYELLC